MIMEVQIAPSVLSADFGRLHEEIAEIEPYSQRLHFDVMDGHFVPNISFGAPVMKWIKTALPIDVHLMIEHPWRYFEDFVKAGGDLLIFHQEVCEEEGSQYDLKNVTAMVKNLGVKVGVSIKPGTSVTTIKGILGMIDQVLIMTVEPGFGGQEFMVGMLPKIAELREHGYFADVAIDGGINEKTSKLSVAAGANILIAGNYIFGAKDRVAAIKSLSS